MPVDWKSFSGVVAPRLPVVSFAWANVLAVLSRVGSGHAAVAAWVAGVLGLGLAPLRWLGPGWTRNGERTILCFGVGAAFGMLVWLGLGLAGLVHPAAGLALAATGAASWAAGRRGLPLAAFRWIGVAVSAALLVEAASIPASWILVRFAERPGLANWVAGGWVALVGAGWVSWAAAFLAREGREGGPVLGSADGSMLRVFAGLAALAFLVTAVDVAAPERFYDAQVYHLAAPALFCMHHKVVGLPNLLHSSFPLGVHMLYVWQWLLGGEPAARAWRLWLTGAIAWTVFRLGSRAGRPAAGLIAAAVFISLPLLLLNAVQTSPDVELTLILLLAALAAAEAGGRLPGVALAGILGGAAFAAKYTAAFFLPWLAGLSALPPGCGRVRPGRFVRGIAAFAAVSLCWAFPWFLRNEAVVGNPVYPYATRLFPGGRQWDPARLERFKEQAAAYVVEKRSDLPRLPWLLTKGNTSENFIGAAFLLLLPVALVHPPAAVGVRVLAGLGGLAVGSWIWVTHIHRFVLAAWGLLALFIAVALWDLLESRRWYARAGLMLLAVTAGTNLVANCVLSRSVFDPVELLAGRESPGGYLDRKMIDSYAPAAFGSRPGLGPRDRVLMVGETRGLYWSAPFYNHSAYDVEVFEEAVRDAASEAGLARRFRQLGVSRIFVNDRECARLKFRFRYPMLSLTARERAVAADFWRKRAQNLLDGGAAWQVYRFPPGPGAPVGAPLPIVFDETALRNEFEGFATITWQGDAVIQMTKKMVGP